MIMNVLVALIVSFFYWLESIFRFFVPRERKDVRGDVVLVTGAGSGLGT